MDLSSSTDLFDLVVRGVLVIALGCLGIIFNAMIVIVLRRPAFKKSSINLLMLCKFTFTQSHFQTTTLPLDSFHIAKISQNGFVQYSS